tara:strand:+ start:260 stop:1072 length:813 start_codon:yes stop_codon:yes gene_type:complete
MTKHKEIDLGLEILIIVLTSWLPIWLFAYSPQRHKSFDRQIAYRLFRFPFYLLHYVLLYSCIADFIVSVYVCDEPLCEHRYTSLYLGIAVLVLTTTLQASEAYYSPREDKKTRKKRMDVRRSIEQLNDFLGGFGQKSSRKSLREKENRRMSAYKKGRRSTKTNWNIKEAIEVELYQVEQTLQYVALEPIYRMIRNAAAKDRTRLEIQLYKAIESRLNRLKNYTSPQFQTINQMISEVRDANTRLALKQLSASIEQSVIAKNKRNKMMSMI